jgi:Base plate wedge protein 53
MAKAYFAKFPFIGYSIDSTGEIRAATDILQRDKVRDSLENDSLIFYRYDVKDGETPEVIAAKFYGWSGYHWVVLLVNNIINPYYDWPMSYPNLTETIRKKYAQPDRDGLEYAYSTIDHYEDSYGNVIDYTTYLTLPANMRSAVSIYDYENQLNENKRHIQLLDKSFLDQIDAELDKSMSTNILQ